MYRRIAVLASLGVMAAMFLGSSTANAVSVTCVFSGLAGNLTPGIPDAVPDILGGSPQAVDTGTYEYEGQATCAGDRWIPSAPNNAYIVSNGVYDNILCGTGWASDQSGASTTVTQVVGGSDQLWGVGYEISFAAGVGPLLIGHGQESVNPFRSGRVIGNYVGAGAVQITPGANPPNSTNVGAWLNNLQTRNNCISHQQTDTFEVMGAFSLVG